MLVSYTWLLEMMDLSSLSHVPTPTDIANILSDIGLEVETVQTVGVGCQDIVIAEIRSCRPHPEGTNLQIVELSTGTHTHTVVCGANNVPSQGGKVAFAPVGATLPNGTKIGLRTLRGVESQGMICSEKELEIGDEQQGILVLDSHFPTGAKLWEQVPGIVDTILTIAVTPNRPDALGHVGVARDIAARLACKLVPPKFKQPLLSEPSSSWSQTLITNQAPERCGRYYGAVVSGVRVGPSPLWMRVRLFRLGLRAINNCVDISNFLLLEQGQPLHFFDRQKLEEGRVVVRKAKSGEVLVTLDQKQLVLDSEDLIIADAGSPQALAGVMGGADSAVCSTTTEVFVEAAYFAPSGIRASAKRHGFSTDSSYRFERGVDFDQGLQRAFYRAINLLEELTGSTLKLQGKVDGHIPSIPTVKLRLKRAAQLLGMEVPKPDAKRILMSLEIHVEAAEEDCWYCTPPSFRPDLTQEEDLIEELMRIYGLEHLKVLEPVSSIRPSASLGNLEMSEQIADGLREVGLHEVISYAFTEYKRLQPFSKELQPQQYVWIKNPMRTQMEVMRTHMLPGLLTCLAFNYARNQRVFRIFEVGRIYRWPRAQRVRPENSSSIDQQLPDELIRAAILLAHDTSSVSETGKLMVSHPYEISALAVCGTLSHALRCLGFIAEAQSMEEKASLLDYLHPGVQARLVVSHPSADSPMDVGIMGEVHSTILADYELPRSLRVYYGEVRMEQLPHSLVPIVYRPVPRFPSTSRDLSLEIPEALPAAEVIQALKHAAKTVSSDLNGDAPHLEMDSTFRGRAIEILDDYRGSGVAKGFRALLLRLHYRAKQRSVTDEEIQQLHTAIAERACQELQKRNSSIRVR